MVEIASQMRAKDPAHTFTVTADRTFVGGTQNRVTIATNSAFLSLLFGSGPNFSTTVAPLIGFTSTDKTGSTSYQGTLTSGTALATEWYGHNYQGPLTNRRNFGAVNISASGEKESVVFALQQFIDVEFQYEPQTKVLTTWVALIDWMISQRPFDFTPEISTPTLVYQVTLEKSSADGKGLAFLMKEMLPMYPFTYTTGAMMFRLRGT